MVRFTRLLEFFLLISLLASACSGTSANLPPSTLPPTLPPPTALPPAFPDVTAALPTPPPPTATFPQLVEPTPTITPLVLPGDLPLTEWKDIPVMSGALAGREDSEGYTYTINLKVRKVQIFYLDTLKALDWEVQATGTKEGALVIAQKDGKILSIAISLHESGVTVVRISLEEGE